MRCRLLADVRDVCLSMCLVTVQPLPNAFGLLLLLLQNYYSTNSRELVSEALTALCNVLHIILSLHCVEVCL